ncbi:hypothetical protein BH09VER1_BH09VER1_47270 [soil metagenome]
MSVLDLGEFSWQLRGWRPFAWQLGRSVELGFKTHSDIPAIPARIPGSVQGALLAAGWLKDWNFGLNSLVCEWVEHRHWEFTTEISSGRIPCDQAVCLCAEGLDYSGWILVDGRTVATFAGALLRHRFDLTKDLSDGSSHELSIVFAETPLEQGQVGFTSKSRYFKPRYNYGWDWCPRFVPVGIWDALTLEIGAKTVELEKLAVELAEDLVSGKLKLHLARVVEGTSVKVTLHQEGSLKAEWIRELVGGEQELVVNVANIRPWWPNGEGEQVLYTVRVETSEGVVAERRIGFKRVRWLPCEVAPAGALPWICEINGRAIFLQGVNWTPIRMDYHSITAEDYRSRIELYREMHCNILRVWGGGFLERELFFDLCDEAGLLVWQEFPLSSSGIENWPPEDEETIAEISRIARDYIRRRSFHACRLLWCGGNELQHEEGRKTGVGRPCDETHPCLAALAKVVAEEDPGVRYLPTSSSGPRFMAEEKEFGLGLHHDVHGPWKVEGELDDWRRYWENDDALLRSETGVPGTASLEGWLHYAGDRAPWPPTEENLYWLHANSWWLQWDRFGGAVVGLSQEEAMEKYVAISQGLQAEALAIAARACRQRFPKCGGFLIWMGHDAFPCPSNTSVIDFDGRPKAAYFAVREVFGCY